MTKKPIPPGENAVSRAVQAIRTQGGMIRMADALRAGIHRNTLRTMVERRELERVTRGLYRLAEAPEPAQPDLVTVARKLPEGVICLISALSFHELTTQIPHEVYVAIARNSEPPRLEYPPLRVFRFSGEAFTEGIEQVQLDGTVGRVYDPEKTLADCFKYRNKLGMDTVLEAIRFYRERRPLKVDALLRYAKVCRIASVMRPYLEAVL